MLAAVVVLPARDLRETLVGEISRQNGLRPVTL
jgi:hypothetical protein